MAKQAQQADPKLDALERICDRLADRTAVAFLGAGVNAGILNGDGISMPLGASLASRIAKDVLGDESLQLPLDHIADIARQKFGARSLNEYIYKFLSSFEPGVAHLAMAQLPWDAIYTTNYDLLLEGAFGNKSINAAGNLIPVVSATDEVLNWSESEIPYYKVHGSLELANTVEGRLILTKSDYRFYEQHRRPLFKRLKKDLASKCFVFIGYSLIDPNFRAVLDDAREELGVASLPLSYALVYSFTSIEEVYWKDAYNIQLIRGDTVDFVDLLKSTWQAGYEVIPLDQRLAREKLLVELDTKFERVTDSFYRVSAGEVTGPSNASRFFLGAEPLWADIRDSVPPKRDLYNTLFEAIFDELAGVTTKPTAYIVTGHAGTGKTTLVKSIAYAIDKEFGLPVLFHIPGTPLDARSLLSLMNIAEKTRVTIVIQHAAECFRGIVNFLEELRAKKLSVTLILEERKNQWYAASDWRRASLNITEFELGTVSRQEIELILDALERHGALGKLQGTGRDNQRSHFESLAERELLVALRELVSDSSFDETVIDEYESIPSQMAKRAYLYTCALGQIDLPIRYESLINILGVPYQKLRDEVFLPAEGILLTLEESGRGRHSAGFRVMARHPVIASIVFDKFASSENDKFEIIKSIIINADPGYREDRRLLDMIVKKKELVSTLSLFENRRAVYELLARALPGDPFVLQHRSALERGMRNPEGALKFARDAVRVDGRNTSLQNTLGLALELSARGVTEPLKRQSLLSEASKLFDEQIEAEPSNAYALYGRFLVRRQNAEQEPNAERKALLRASLIGELEDAMVACDGDPIIASELSKERGNLGEVSKAIELLESALSQNASDSRLQDLLCRYLVTDKQFDRALDVALQGSQSSPTAWRLQRRVAQIRALKMHSLDSIRPYYEAAIRFQKNDVGLRIEYGAFLFTRGEYGDASKVFSDASQIPMSGRDLRSEREYWTDGGTNRQFRGRVKSISGAGGQLLAEPENFETYFMRTGAGSEDVRVGDKVRFEVAFNVRGAIARNIRRV